MTPANSGEVDITSELAPLHASCKRRHSPDLPCWVGRRIRAHLEAVLAEHGDVCVHCHLAGADSVEHVKPRSRWGSDDLDNLRPAHRDCNARRGVRAMAGYRPGRELEHSSTVARILARAGRPA